jgi:hypothetical protein
MASIPLLPEEILGLITSTLEISDFSSFRLVSREVNKKTFQNFSSTYFGTVSIDLSPQSINKLQALSDQEHITQNIHTLLVKDKRGTLGQGSLLNWNGYPSTDSPTSAPDIARLCSILTKKLKACRSFSIEDHCSLADDDAFDRKRYSGSDAIRVVLAIISQTGLPVKAFSLHLGPRGAGRVDMKKLNMPHHYGPNLQSSWAHLQELTLSFTVDSDAFDWALSLIVQAKNLRSLMLGLDIHESEAFFARLSDHGGLPKIEKLELKSTRISKETFLTLLLHFRPTLQTLVLRGVEFESGVWTSAFLEMRHATSQIHTLQISSLNDCGGLVIFPSLRTTTESSDTDDRTSIEVLDEEIDLEMQAASIRYQGEHIDLALERLSNNAEYYESSPSPRGSKSVCSYPASLSNMLPVRDCHCIFTNDFEGRNPNELSVKKYDQVNVIRDGYNCKCFLPN